MSLAVPGTMTSYYNINRICYRGGACNHGSGGGIWALALSDDNSYNSWGLDFRFIYNIRICYRGGSCANASGSGMWALNLADDVSGSYWSNGFRLKLKYRICYCGDSCNNGSGGGI